MSKILPLNDIEIGNSKLKNEKFCSICQSYLNCDNTKFFKSDCNHEWCKECHLKLIKFDDKCPLCRNNLKIKKKFKKDKNVLISDINVFKITITLINILIFVAIMFIGRLTYILIICNLKCKYFENNIFFWSISAFLGYILFSMIATFSIIFTYATKKFCIKYFF